MVEFYEIPVREYGPIGHSDPRVITCLHRDIGEDREEILVMRDGFELTRSSSNHPYRFWIGNNDIPLRGEYTKDFGDLKIKIGEDELSTLCDARHGEFKNLNC